MQIYFLILDKSLNKIISLPTSSKFKQRVGKSHTHTILQRWPIVQQLKYQYMLKSYGPVDFFVIVITLGVGYWFLTPVNIFQMPYSEPV